MSRRARLAPRWRCPRILVPAGAASRSASDTRETAYRANNLGVARLERLKYRRGRQRVSRGALGRPRTGHGTAEPQPRAALRAGPRRRRARGRRSGPRCCPRRHSRPTCSALIARAQNRNDVARGHFERVRQIDPRDVGTSVNVGQIALEDRRYDEAIAVLQPVVAGEPYNVTAVVRLGLALTRSGQRRGRTAAARARRRRSADWLRRHPRHRISRAGALRRSHRVDGRRGGTRGRRRPRARSLPCPCCPRASGGATSRP